jgi:hypothetical protein
MTPVDGAFMFPAPRAWRARPQGCARKRPSAPAAKLDGQKQIKTLESTRNRKRRELFDAQDAIDVQRDDLIAKIESQMRQRTSLLPIFTLKWGIL